MGHTYLSHSHPIAIYACPIPWETSHGIPIGMTFPWTSLGIKLFCVALPTAGVTNVFETASYFLYTDYSEGLLAS